MSKSVIGVTDTQDRDEWVTIKVKRYVKEELLKIASLLQFKEGKSKSFNDVIEYLISNCEIQIPANGFNIVTPQKKP